MDFDTNGEEVDELRRVHTSKEVLARQCVTLDWLIKFIQDNNAWEMTTKQVSLRSSLAISIYPFVAGG